MSWDDNRGSNGFILKGNSGNNPINDPTDGILAFTFGNTSKWLSTDAKNLDTLVYDSESAVKGKKKLFVSVMTYSKIAEVFSKIDKPDNIDIKIYLTDQIPGQQPRLQPNSILKFKNVTKVDKQPKTISLSELFPALKGGKVGKLSPILIYTFRYENMKPIKL